MPAPGDFFGGQADHSDSNALGIEDGGLVDILDWRRRVRGKKREVCALGQRPQRIYPEIEFIASNRGRIVTDRIHDFHDGLALKRVGN